MARRAETFFSCFLLVIVGWLLVQSFSYRLEVRLTPLIIGVPTALMLIWKIFDNLVATQRSSVDLEKRERSFLEGEERGKKVEKHFVKRELIVLASLFFFVILICFVGFLVAIPLFLFILLKGQYSESWFSSITVALGAGVMGYVLFELVLEVPLFQGFLFG